MLELRSDHDLALEALGAHSRGQIRRQNFHDDATAEGAFLGEKDATHPAAADLAVQRVPGAERGLELILKGSVHANNMSSGQDFHDDAADEAATAAASGSETTKVAPRSGLFSADIRPPWATTIDRQMERPSPRPSRLVVTNGSKIDDSATEGIPLPQSRTSMRASSSCLVETVSTRSAGGVPLIASHAFTIRFRSTCCNCTSSVSTIGSWALKRVFTITPRC